GYRKIAKGQERAGGLEVDEQAATVVREVFQRRAAGEPWVALCSFLDERLPRPNGRAWVKSNVMDMIKRRTYLGEASGGGVVNADAHPAIVTRGEFEAAQQAKADGRTARAGTLLAGLLRCSGCGHALTHYSDGKRGYSNYKCRKHHGDGRCPAP